MRTPVKLRFVHPGFGGLSEYAASLLANSSILKQTTPCSGGSSSSSFGKIASQSRPSVVTPPMVRTKPENACSDRLFRRGSCEGGGIRGAGGFCQAGGFCEPGEGNSGAGSRLYQSCACTPVERPMRQDRSIASRNGRLRRPLPALVSSETAAQFTRTNLSFLSATGMGKTPCVSPRENQASSVPRRA